MTLPGEELMTATNPEIEELESLSSEETARQLATMVAEKKAGQVVVMRVRELVQYADYFVICSGHSDRQVSAIREHVIRQARTQLDERPISVEGIETHQWVIVDFGDVVVHVFFDPVREYYKLEELWGDAPRVKLDLPTEALVGQDPYPA
jgi:ribosome-associated protein